MIVEKPKKESMVESKWVHKLTGGYMLDSDFINSDASWDIMLVDESSIKLDLQFGETSFNHDNGWDTRATNRHNSHLKESNLKTPKTQADNWSDLNSSNEDLVSPSKDLLDAGFDKNMSRNQAIIVASQLLEENRRLNDKLMSMKMVETKCDELEEENQKLKK